MNVKQVAQKMEVSASTVYALVAAGKLKCNRIGLGRGCVRISEQQVEEYLARPQSNKEPTRFRHIQLP